MRTRKGSAAELVVFGIAVLIVGALLFGSCVNRHVIGNKQYFDFKQNFRTAYVEENGREVMYRIRAWKDWDDSDAVQIVTEDGTTIYTHLNRVRLTDR